MCPTFTWSFLSQSTHSICLHLYFSLSHFSQTDINTGAWRRPDREESRHYRWRRKKLKAEAECRRIWSKARTAATILSDETPAASALYASKRSSASSSPTLNPPTPSSPSTHLLLPHLLLPLPSLPPIPPLSLPPSSPLIPATLRRRLPRPHPPNLPPPLSTKSLQLLLLQIQATKQSSSTEANLLPRVAALVQGSPMLPETLAERASGLSSPSPTLLPH